jgi:hypothetical protein
MTLRSLRFASALLLSILSLPSLAGGELRVSLPNRGAVVLVVPQGWKEQINRPYPDAPPTITLTPAGNTSFQVLVTPIWPANASVPKATAQALRSQVGSAAAAAKAQAVESDLPVLELAGPNVFGSYFSATDRAPKPGEYKNLTQGLLSLSELRVAFTVLSNGDRLVVLEPALDMLKSMRREPAR